MNMITLMQKHLEHLENAKLTNEAIKSKNLKKFRKLVEYAYRNSEYYSDLIRKNKIDCEHCTPSQFPVMTKIELMENFDRIVTDKRITKQKVSDFLEISKNPMELMDGKYYVVHTSGSSGQVGYFVYSQKDWSRGIAHSFRMHSHSLGFKRKRIGYFGAAQGHFAGVSICVSAGRSMSKLLFNVETFDINSSLQNIIEGLNKFQPDILVGYAHGLRLLAQKQLVHELHIAPSVIENSGEDLSESDRNIIRKAFDSELLNLYASSEHLFMGMGKDEYDGLYLFEDDLIFEIEKDCSFVTNLFNYTLPLIRYKMEDILVPKADEKGVFPFTKVNEIIGRKENIPIFINKYGAQDFISPILIAEIIIKNIKAFQIELLDKKSFIFYAVFEDDISDEEKYKAIQLAKERLKEILSEKNMDNVSFEVQEVNELKIDKKAGKFKLIYSRPH